MNNPNKSRADVITKQRTLSSLEEKVIRMLYGLDIPGNSALQYLGEDHPKVAAELAAIERRAFACVGPRSGFEKRKIIEALVRKRKE